MRPGGDYCYRSILNRNLSDMEDIEQLPADDRPEIEPIQVEMYEPARLMIHVAQAAAICSPDGSFAFDDNVRNAIGMQLLKYVKRVIKEY